jgi:hypothetical protein
MFWTSSLDSLALLAPSLSDLEEREQEQEQELLLSSSCMAKGLISLAETMRNVERT